MEPARTPLVELLWWKGCPSTERTLAELRQALVDAGLDPEAVLIREVVTEDDVAREGFHGSPTVRVEGADVDPPGARQPLGLACRVYRRSDGRISPTPDPARIREALAPWSSKRSPA